jgi:uncharacterized protein YggE
MSSFRNYYLKKINIKVLAACICILVSGVVIYVPNSPEGYAQPLQNNSTLSVTGIATMKIKPDRATVSFGVETANATASSSLMSNSEVVNKLLNVLKAAGVQQNETTTSSFIITPNYNYSESGTIGNITGYTTTNSIQIESSNINKISTWIDLAVSTGANRVDNIYFSVSDKILNDIKNNLLKDAINNAKSKADIAASILGLKVIGVRSINLDGFELPPPILQPYLSQKSLAAGAESSIASTPIITGEQEVTTQISIVFSLGR